MHSLVGIPYSPVWIPFGECLLPIDMYLLRHGEQLLLLESIHNDAAGLDLDVDELKNIGNRQ